MMIDHTTDRAALEVAAMVDCDFPLDVIAAATTEELRAMIIAWIEAGDETRDA